MLGRSYKLCSTVWVLVGVLLVLVGSVISLDSYLVELKNIGFNGQNMPDLGLVNI